MASLMQSQPVYASDLAITGLSYSYSNCLVVFNNREPTPGEYFTDRETEAQSYQ